MDRKARYKQRKIEEEGRKNDSKGISNLSIYDQPKSDRGMKDPFDNRSHYDPDFDSYPPSRTSRTTNGYSRGYHEGRPTYSRDDF